MPPVSSFEILVILAPNIALGAFALILWVRTGMGGRA